MTGKRHFFALLAICTLLVLTAGCASSQEKSAVPEGYANVVELNPPAAGQHVAGSTVYIDSVKVIERDGSRSLLIMGNFPDGCTHISEAEHQSADAGLSLRIKAWRNSEQMCTQALVPFSFIYQNLPESALEQARSIYINKTEFPLI